ncbi:twin-arginine translocase subunit TatC [Candidatus Saccharibacteria bacterium]|nr:twin-arginine translocase subunit TatC [Candidatus Saccharibacteria bacterium]
MNQPFIGHVHELRRRLSWSALLVFAVAVAAYFWREPILRWLSAPLGQTLYYDRVTGAFEFVMQACLLAGVLAATPLIIYHLIAFIRPALPRPLSNKAIISTIILATLLIGAGVLFGYYVSLPAALTFLSHIDTTNLHPLIAANSYLTFVMAFLAIFGLVFLLPLLIILSDNIRPIPPSALIKARKWVIIGAFAAALILPIAPDPVSQVMLAMPIIIMYEISIWLIKYKAWRRRGAIATPVVALPLPEAAAQHVGPPASVSRPPRARHAPMRPQVIDLRSR